MNKIYKIILTLLLLILLGANIVFFSYSDEFLSYFKMDSELESADSIIKRSFKEPKGIFDLSIVEDEKFKNLKDFDFSSSDLDQDIDFPDTDTDDDFIDIIDKEPEFEVGNINPFTNPF